MNAHAPDPDRPQEHFRFDYSGGWRTYGRAQLCALVRDECRPYDGPRLVFLVAACKAPDGSYWALQRWQRLAPMRGFDPFLPGQAAIELHVSHWSGPLPVLEVSPNWTYGGTLQGLFGRLTYRGEAVHGFRTPSATRRDPYARFVYIDTFNSVYGPGWKRDTGIVTHPRNGAFCYSFVAAGPAARLPVERAARPRQRRAAPGHGHGPGGDACRAVGGQGTAPLRRRHRTGCSTGASTGWSVTRTGSARPSAELTASRNPTAPPALRSRHRPSRRARREGLPGGTRRVARPRRAHPRARPPRSRPADCAPTP